MNSIRSHSGIKSVPQDRVYSVPNDYSPLYFFGGRPQDGGYRNSKCKSWGPNSDMGEPGLEDRELISTTEFAARAKVDVRWLRNEIRKGRLDAVKDEAPAGKRKFRYLINEKLIDRVRLRYLRGRKTFMKGLTRDGIRYLHDGSIHKTKIE